jgi:deoxycytidylate deaminase
MTERSRCDRAKIAAVIVSPHQRIVATGYNGPPARWTPPPPGELTTHCVDWCDRAQLIIEQGHSPVSEAVSALYEDCPTIHAEINALLYSDPHERKRGTIYVTGSVCMACAKAIGNSGITTVTLVNVDEEADAHRNPTEVRKFLVECDVRVRHVRV